MTRRLRYQCQTCIKIRTTQLTIGNPNALKIQIKPCGVVVDIFGNIYRSLVATSINADQRYAQGTYRPAYLNRVSNEVQMESVLAYEHFHH